MAGGRGGARHRPRPDADPRIEKLVASVSVDHLRRCSPRWPGSARATPCPTPPSSTRGIGAARQWIFDELRRSSPKLQVSFDTYRVAPQGRITQEVEIRNVMAVLPGRSSRRIYVTGHYDSLNIPDQTRNITRPTPLPPGFDAMAQPGQDFNVDAAGANDDGSGTVLTLELARRFAESGIDFDATLVFICWAGEEQGLIGSTAHAQRLAGEKVAVDAMFDNDIVGNSRGGNGIVDGASVRVYSDGPEDSMSRSLARYIQKLSALYVPSHRIRLFARQDRFGRGSDHQSFNGFGFPAVVFREANENYQKQHSANDTLEGVDFDYLAQNARANTAAVAALGLAPPAPGVLSERGQPLLGRDPSGYDANLRWVASPGAAAYRIYWRDGWATDWQHQQFVGKRDPVRAAEAVDRQRCHRRRGGRPRWSRKPGQRLRLAVPPRPGCETGRVAPARPPRSFFTFPRSSGAPRRPVRARGTSCGRAGPIRRGRSPSRGRSSSVRRIRPGGSSGPSARASAWDAGTGRSSRIETPTRRRSSKTETISSKSSPSPTMMPVLVGTAGR